MRLFRRKIVEEPSPKPPPKPKRYQVKVYPVFNDDFTLRAWRWGISEYSHDRYCPYFTISSGECETQELAEAKAAEVLSNICTLVKLEKLATTTYTDNACE